MKGRMLGVFGLMLSVLACSSSSDTSNSGDSWATASPDTVTSTDVGSATGRSDSGVTSADTSSGSSVLVPECADSDDCSTDEACSCQGVCVDVAGKTACTEPKNCGSGSWCDPCTGHCESTKVLCEPCSTSGLCPTGGACRAPEEGACEEQGVCIPFATGGNYCGRACLTSAGCPNGYECVDIDGAANKQCVPVSGECADLGLCDGDADCPEGEICQQGPQTCGPGCSDDAGCPVGQVCNKARCADPCQTDADCILPELCQEDGHCKDPDACETWLECPPEHYCHKDDGTCVAGCQLDDQCADASKVCEAGTCVPKGCQHNYQCAFEQECDADSGECVPMTRPHCSACDASAQDAAQCDGEPNLCVTFQDDQGAALGDYCILTCDSDPIDGCPHGYGCEHIEAPDAGIDGYYCVRQCWQDPYGN